MNKKNYILISAVSILIISFFVTLTTLKKNNDYKTNKLSATVMSSDNESMVIKDQDNIIYTFKCDRLRAKSGDNIVIEYTGVIDTQQNIKCSNIKEYEIAKTSKDEDGVPTDYSDNGIFSDYYILAYNDVKNMSLDEKIGQILLVRYPNENQKEILTKNKFAGYLFFEKDFANKTSDEVKKMISDLQKVSEIPILTAVDEEGGTVVRVSSNTNLSKEKFKSPSELYTLGGFDKIKEDTINKSKLLNELGLNLNLAPVVDVSTNPDDYMYQRTLKKDTNLTSTYAKTVIESSKSTGVSYTLKHFPGYGNNADTHTTSSKDTRSRESIMDNDIPPFKEGIKSGAEAVLVSHNIVNSIDPDNPASLSPSIHNILRNDLAFTGIIITDDLDMGAVKDISDSTVKAILAGNDLIITTDYDKSIKEIKDAVNRGEISEEIISKLAFRVLAWKYYKGMMFTNQK